jgi:hypothetical protein
LTEHGCDLTGALATKEFARWQPQSPHIRNDRYPSADGAVSKSGPIGTGERTEIGQNRRYGT